MQSDMCLPRLGDLRGERPAVVLATHSDTRLALVVPVLLLAPSRIILISHRLMLRSSYTQTYKYKASRVLCRLGFNLLY